MGKLCAAALSAFLIIGCGTTGAEFSDDVVTQAPPTVTRVDPATGPVGTAITIFGFGFSTAAPANVVVIGGSGASATDYQLLANPTSNEIESLTATIPNDAQLGTSGVVVVVYDNISNADVTFEVTP